MHSHRPIGSQRSSLKTMERFVPHPHSRTGACAAAAGKEAAPATTTAKPKVIGVGSCGVDYLAAVAQYPKPDEKLRTTALEVQGGGNAANALTAAARLGLAPALVTKIGGDGLGDGILAELTRDGVSTDFVLRADGQPSPFTYIIVDQSGGTRTCIHTPGTPLTPAEVTPELAAAALDGAALIYFDGRLTDAALVLARAARAAGVPVLVEGERLRPGLDELLQEADYVATSAHFPKEWTGEAELGDAMVEIARRLPNAKVVVTTRGARGCVALRRSSSDGEAAAAADAEALVDVIARLEQETADTSSSGGGLTAPDCVSTSGIELRRPPVASTRGAVRLTYSAARDTAGAAARAGAAAAAEAARNADGAPGRAASYAGTTATATATAAAPFELAAEVFVAPAAKLDSAHVADTTGAGDAFIGSLLYGLVSGLELPATLQLGAVVAACKCTALGARPGLPQRAALSPSLLLGQKD